MAAGIQVAVDTRFAEQAEPGAKTQRSLQGSVKDNLFLSLSWQSKQCLVPETMNILGRASSAWCRTKESLVWGDVINLFIVGLYDCLFALALIRLIDIRHGFVLLKNQQETEREELFKNQQDRERAVASGCDGRERERGRSGQNNAAV